MTDALEADPRWISVKSRDRAADGRFFYSVETTGVFCRPSCAARLPNPKNVRFHATAQDAERSGYRPCKRCRPDQAPLEAERVVQVCRLIDAAEEVPSLGTLARAAGLSPSRLHRVFKAATGVTPREYAAALRAQRLRSGLERGAKVTSAMLEAGFNSTGRLYAQTDARLGMKPTAYRAGGQGAEIRFAVGKCALGAVLVAATGKGLCAILLGGDPDALVHDLERRFPAAALLGGDAAFEQHVAAVVAFVEAPAKGLLLPLDIRGTAFQQRVWKALREVPAGSTVSYAQLAAKLGAAGSARAVATACAANPLAVAIPCHRVVRTDGGLSGYRWGVERKRELLERERR